MASRHPVDLAGTKGSMSDTGNTARARAKFNEAQQQADAASGYKLISVDDALDQLVDIGKKPVITTGLPTVDSALGFDGLLTGQVYDLCAGTGRGKTSLAGQIARHRANEGDAVLYPFYEAFAGYNVARMASGPMGVRSNEIIRAVEKHRAGVKKHVPAKIHFLSRPTLKQIGQATRDLADKTGKAPTVIVDYIQKLGDVIQTTMKNPDPRLAMSMASAGLLELAESTGATVIAINSISRMNNRRAVDPRRCPPYEFVDVAKESGAVEYDSAGMLVLSLSSDYEGDERIATLTVAKARYGTEMHIDMRFDGARGAWRDLGRVEADDTELRGIILDALDTPCASSNELIKRTKKRGADVRAILKKLTKAGEVHKTDDGYQSARSL
jgi:replicative DNA helicase